MQYLTKDVRHNIGLTKTKTNMYRLDLYKNTKDGKGKGPLLCSSYYPTEKEAVAARKVLIRLSSGKNLAPKCAEAIKPATYAAPKEVKIWSCEYDPNGKTSNPYSKEKHVDERYKWKSEMKPNVIHDMSTGKDIDVANAVTSEYSVCKLVNYTIIGPKKC
jgi:hypothetical protein